MISLAILCVVITFVHLSKPEVTAEYLNGVHRLNNPSYVDYYFCCNAEGPHLRMVVNEEPLVLFRGIDSGRTMKGSQDNFNYSAIPISVNSIAEKRYEFDAIMVISVASATSIEVECTSGSDRNTTDNNRGALSEGNPTSTLNNSDLVMMQQLFSGRVVRSLSGNMTYGFICGVDGTSQTWTVENIQISFSILNNIGDSRPSHPDMSPILFYQLAFLSAREPYNLVSVLFVTGDPGETVTCNTGVHRAHLPIVDFTHRQDYTTYGQNQIENISTSIPLLTLKQTASTMVVHSSAHEDITFRAFSIAWRNEPTSATAGLLLAVGLVIKQLYC